ncbi:bile acid:sodium symporter family protein [Nocardia rosealba]|uniref:bile acid:sodium symporter family protein n=1 Tax=Nocardia rosealba TaxID=2878563 RepID=UPI001CDA3502|nr:bile acid:sodium symporter family protein [Nocardia rosealba]MCA2207436.1 bile acid:sodium symporter family protein [Nocardia rosealba]
MNSSFLSTALPPALAVIMFGLGLSLTGADFTRVARAPKAVAVALVCQVIVLPAVAFGLVMLFDLEPLLAVGMMLLAASPGGATANLFSHLFRGDVALNVTLTAVNSMLCVVTVPVVTNLAIHQFADNETGQLGLQFGKTVQVIAIVLIPVLIGMQVRRRAPEFAGRMDLPVRIASVLILAVIVAVTMIADRAAIGGYFLDVGAITMVFCVISLTTGYLVPLAFGVSPPQAIASSMEVGVHNSAIAITLAITVLDSARIAVPAAVYAVLMTPLATLFGALISRRAVHREPAPVTA